MIVWFETGLLSWNQNFGFKLWF